MACRDKTPATLPPSPRRRSRLLPIVGAVATAVVAAACTVRSPDEPTQVSEARTVDFKEEANDPARFRQIPPGGELSEQRSENILIYRAAETTLENGMEGFRVIGLDTDPDTRHRSADSVGGYGFTPVSWHRQNSLAGARGDNAISPDSYKGFAEIQMFETAPAVSGQDGIYDARQVLRDLSASRQPVE